jgi:hypothetical protein
MLPVGPSAIKLAGEAFIENESGECDCLYSVRSTTLAMTNPKLLSGTSLND